MFGGREEQGEEQQQPEMQGQQEAQAPHASGFTQYEQQGTQDADPCSQLLQSFQACVAGNSSNMNVCAWPVEQLRECRLANGQTPEF